MRLAASGYRVLYDAEFLSYTPSMRTVTIGVSLLGILAAVGCGRMAVTPLIGAARAGDVARLRTLLAEGADPNERGGVNDWTPLLHAIHKNQPESVKMLLEGGADINAKGREGMTPLIMAAGYGYADIVGLLLDRGADPQALTNSGVTALSAAVGGVPDIDRFTVGRCQDATVRTLLAHEPDLRMQSNAASQAALRVAKLGGCTAVVNLVDR